MENYNPEVAREIYLKLQASNEWNFPITATLVHGILENFVYGFHTQGNKDTTDTLHLEIPWSILSLPLWEQVQKWVHEIIENDQKQAA